jgi:Peptidase A4 family
VFFADPVQPGDAVSAAVVADGGGVFTLTLSDSTQGWTRTTQQVEAAARLGSAEVIAEAPSDGTVLPLADFGTVNFTGAMVNGAPIGAANLSELIMESAAGAVLATPSPLTGAAAAAGPSGGSAFSVTSVPSATGGGGPLTSWDIGDQG